MQKTVVSHSGSKVGIYYPITGKFILESGKQLKLDKGLFEDYCDDMGWRVL